LEIHELVIESADPPGANNSAVYKRTLPDDQVWAIKIASNRRRLQDECPKRSALANGPYLVEAIALHQVLNKSILERELCLFGDLNEGEV
jgi:hypothetical protein